MQMSKKACQSPAPKVAAQPNTATAMTIAPSHVRTSPRRRTSRTHSGSPSAAATK